MISPVTTPSDPSPDSFGNAAPSLPLSATYEERERHWYQHVYQGNRQRQLTLRALIMGGALGLLMSLSNLYTTVKLGWSFGVAVTASVLSYVLWNSLRLLSGGRVKPLSLLESNCMQSTASSAGYSTGATVALCFGASLLATGSHYPWYVVAPFVLCTAGMGVFLAIPMKRQLVNREQLPFPTGTAAAETLRSLYGQSREALRKAYALLGGLGVGMLIGGLRTYGTFVAELAKTPWRQPWLESLQKRLFITDEIPLAGFLNPLSRGQMAGLSFEPSVLLVGAGMIMGARVCLSMVFGAVLLYYVVAPLMLTYDSTHAQITGYVPAFRLNPQGGFNPVRWSLWGGASLMVFASLTALALDWRTLARAFRSLGRQEPTRENQSSHDVEVPTSWFFLGFIPFAIGMVFLLRLTFEVSIPLGITGVLLSAVVSLVCARVTGETDTTPMGAMGKVTQLLYAVLPGSAGNATINLMTAGATTGAGLASADLLQDLKSGYLLGAHPRQQFWAQFAGIFAGVLGIVPCWYLMFPTKEALERFNPPAVNMWKAVSDVLTQGIQTLPSTALWLIILGALIGICLPILERLFPRAKPYLPSATGLGLSWVVVFQNSLAIGIGAAIVWLWSRQRRSTAETFATPVASGLIAGESLTAAFIAIGCTLIGLLAQR
jgi:uncharacterized oligopeptide transporter (OPT) family protein